MQYSKYDLPIHRNTAPAAPSSPDALGLGFELRLYKVRVREALVILDEASYCWPVRTVQSFYGPILV